MATIFSPHSVGFWATCTPAADKRFHFRLGRARGARDDGAGVAHFAAGRRRDAGDVGRHGLGHAAP